MTVPTPLHYLQGDVMLMSRPLNTFISCSSMRVCIGGYNLPGPTALGGLGAHNRVANQGANEIVVQLMQGLKGLDVGRQLIYRTCQALHTELPTVRTFLTMSPIPGFLPWLRRCVGAAVAAEASAERASHNTHASGAVSLR